MKITRSAVTKVVMAMLECRDLRKATLYLDPETSVRCARRFKLHKLSRRDELLLTLGRPNYNERAFIRACKKAGEPFPVKKLQLKWWKK